ncbi:MAG: putative serine/threonine protein kinase [bacterium]|nr:putative serine/threonine protein kinase [bacterium]
MSDQHRHPHGGFALEPTSPSDDEPSRLPAIPGGSRVDNLPQDFLQVLSRRPLLPGDVIAGRYKLIETLGNGAMGQVFVGEIQSIGRRVAIKVLRPELLVDAQFRRRFQQEAEAVAAIEHRNVARFFDLVVGDPTFLVMEYVPGPTLAAAMRKRPLEAVRAINIVRRLCWALEAAHRAGVIHRDIKPSNIILAPDVENGDEPKLIDFGLAKVAATTLGEGLTRSGQIIGTPQYMSPEQIANRDVDARSDVYSLGCVLYEMVAGRPPFGADEDVKVLYQQVHVDPPAPSTIVPALPPQLDAVIARCLAKDPEARFASMQEMAAALASIDRRRLAGAGSRGTDNRSVGVGYGVVLGAFVVGALATGGGMWLGTRQAAIQGEIVVTSQPSGATVEVDGRAWRQTTPTAVSGLGGGRHNVRVSAAGHAAVEQSVVLERGGRGAVEVSLPAAQREVELQSIPGGARVFVDGQLAPSRTPMTVALAQDDFHELRFELEGYESEVRAIKPEDRDAIVSAHLEVAKLDRGTLWIDGPLNTDVWMDGAPTGAATPTIGLQVATGNHTIELRTSDGSVLAKKTISVARGQIVHVTPLAK